MISTNNIKILFPSDLIIYGVKTRLHDLVFIFSRISFALYYFIPSHFYRSVSSLNDRLENITIVQHIISLRKIEAIAAKIILPYCDLCTSYIRDIPIGRSIKVNRENF